mgnify:CR=1 FL=1
MNRAIAVVGPTGSGKTRLAIELARRLKTEIISADSMQFYRGMEIGTAAPTDEEQAQARHHFVGFLQPDQEMAAGHYQRIARAKAAELLQRGRVPVLVGGSGLYISAFIDGLFDGPARELARIGVGLVRELAVGQAQVGECRVAAVGELAADMLEVSSRPIEALTLELGHAPVVVRLRGLAIGERRERRALIGRRGACRDRERRNQDAY